MWIAVGGNPASAARAGALGLPMALAIIGGMPERFAPFAEIHRRAAREAQRDHPALSINSHGFIADTTQEAADVSWPPFEAMMTKIGRERGWPPMTREQFEASRSLRGANFVGSPQEVIEKILFQHEIFGHERFLLQLTVGSLDHARTMRAIELYGTEVAPVVRAEVGRRGAIGERPRMPLRAPCSRRTGPGAVSYRYVHDGRHRAIPDTRAAARAPRRRAGRRLLWPGRARPGGGRRAAARAGRPGRGRGRAREPRSTAPASRSSARAGWKIRSAAFASTPACWRARRVSYADEVEGCYGVRPEAGPR